MKFHSHPQEFFRKHAAFIDMVTGRMAMDVERGIKTTAGTPVLTGAMKASARHFRNDRGKFRVEVNKEYASVQERGQRAGSRPFTNYTTPGTGAGWFARAIGSVVTNQLMYIEVARKAVGL